MATSWSATASIVLVGDGVGVVLVGDGVGLVVFVDVGDVVGVVVLLVLVPVLGLGVTLFDVLPLLVGVAVADVLLLRVGAALVVVPVLVGRLADGLTLADADRRGVVVPAGELLVGVPLADGDPPVEEALELGLVLPLVLAVPDALTVPLALVEALPLPADRACGRGVPRLAVPSRRLAVVLARGADSRVLEDRRAWSAGAGPLGDRRPAVVHPDRRRAESVGAIRAGRQEHEPGEGA